MRLRAFTVVVASVAATTFVVAGSTVAAAPDAAGVARAQATERGVVLARAHGPVLGLTGEQGIKAKDVVLDSDGAQHVRFDRTFKGLPVVGGDFVIHSGADSGFRGVDGRSRDFSVMSTTPEVSPQNAAATATTAAMEAAARATPHAATTKVTPFTATTKVTPFTATQSAPKLAVYAVRGGSRLVWQTQVDGVGAQGEPAGEVVFVDARTGAVVDQWPTVLNETGTGTGLYVGTVPLTTSVLDGQFQMIDNSRGGARTEDGNNWSPSVSSADLFTDADNVWGNGSASDRQSAAVDAAYGVGATWDFYLNTFGRNGIKDNGVGAKTLVHLGTNWVNAQWNDQCFCMRFGDGDAVSYGPLVSLDVAGHEMTHGVTSSTAGLYYSAESGALNESTSDVMGTMVEFSANNAGDPGDYLMGERFALNGAKPLRYMDRPSRDGVSADCWSKKVGNLDVHNSSGVGNHLFYLLSEGSGAKTINEVSYDSPTCNHSTVTGIGRDKAAAIWYKALTTYWVATTDYADARVGMLSAASALYGATSPEYTATSTAWTAVGVR